MASWNFFTLYDFGLRGRLPIFQRQFLSRRFSRVRIGSILSEASSLDNGVPQGSILSVTLLAVAINGAITMRFTGLDPSFFVNNF